MVKKRQGGVRPGAGAPKKEDKKVTYSTKLRPDQIEALRAMDNAGGWLEVVIDKAIAALGGGGLAQVEAIKKASLPVDNSYASRHMEWTCTCGENNMVMAKGATVACGVCKKRVSSGLAGLLVTEGIKTRAAMAWGQDTIYLITDWGPGVWISDIMGAEAGTILPWADRIPHTPDGTVRLDKL